MKFTDGYWHMRPGVTPHFPVQVHEVEIEPDALTVYGATRRLAHRGDTLNGMLLTLCLSAPTEGVIRVTACHHSGDRLKKAAFELKESGNHCRFEVNQERLGFSSGSLVQCILAAFTG